MDRFKNLNKSKLRVYTLSPFTIGRLDGYPAVEVMQDGCKQYKELGLKHWLSSGTLIGLYRDGRLIPFDTDIDVNVYVTNPISISLKGFVPIRAMTYDEYPMQQAWIKDGVIFDTYFFYDDGEYAINVNEHGIIKKPKKFIDKLDVMEYDGFSYSIPGNIDDFLSWRFGDDWKTPKKTKKSWEKDANHLTGWDKL